MRAPLGFRCALKIDYYVDKCDSKSCATEAPTSLSTSRSSAQMMYATWFRVLRCGCAKQGCYKVRHRCNQGKAMAAHTANCLRLSIKTAYDARRTSSDRALRASRVWLFPERRSPKRISRLLGAPPLILLINYLHGTPKKRGSNRTIVQSETLTNDH